MFGKWKISAPFFQKKKTKYYSLNVYAAKHEFICKYKQKLMFTLISNIFLGPLKRAKREQERGTERE